MNAPENPSTFIPYLGQPDKQPGPSHIHAATSVRQSRAPPR
jgi:hypothetical protein